MNFYEKYHLARNLPLSAATPGVCEYNPNGVLCDNRTKCWKCGWNPKVEEERKAETRGRMREETK